jgi:hypothetical protein
MANDMVALANGTTGAAVASVSFTSINGTYKDLFLVCDASPSSSNAILQISMNSNSPAINRVYISGGSSSQVTGSGASIQLAASGVSASTRFGISCSVLDYAATDKGKVAIIRSGGNTRSNLTVLQQNTTSAITTITISFSSGNIQTGAFFALYGIR